MSILRQLAGLLAIAGLFPASPALRPRHVDRADHLLSRSAARSSACACASGRTCSAIPLPRDPALVNQFVVEDADGRKPLVGRDGADPAGLLRVADAGPARRRLSQQPERSRTARRKIQSVSERRRPRRGRGAASPPQPDRRRRAELFLALRQEPGALGIGRARHRPTGNSASRWSSWPSAIRTPSAPVRIFRFA